MACQFDMSGSLIWMCHQSISTCSPEADADVASPADAADEAEGAEK